MRWGAGFGGWRRTGAAARVVRLARFALLAVALLALISAAPRLRPPRGAEKITKILAEGPHAGDCERCHTMHAEGAPAPQSNALIGPNDNTLCQSCHDTDWAGGSYAGTWTYTGSSHGSSNLMIWPGPDPPARIEPGAQNKCVNCHDPHGWTDTSGKIPMLALLREEKLCFTCHDGSPAATHVQADFLKPFRHPATDYSGRHTGPAESQPADFAVSLNRRHAECADCHNPHVARHDPLAGTPKPDASKTLLGVSRVSVLNGAAGTVPAYAFLAASDTLTQPVTEYQLCFKCHSSWTTQPTGQTDLARVLNPANPSFHPVEAAGANPGILSGAFVPGWSASSLTSCGDCHGSDFGAVRGPHGSSYRHLLKAPYDAMSGTRAMESNELCFSCHSFDVYANPAAPEMVRAASRFNAPSVARGHAEHVGASSVPCASCHVTHGSATQPFLLVTGRVPGILSYTPNANGGTCAATCHGAKSYTVNYAR